MKSNKIRKYRYDVILITLFIVANVILRFFSIDGATFTEGADSAQYLKPAISLAMHGEFSESGSRLFTEGTPLYSILLSIPFKLLGFYESETTIIFFQSLMLFITGMVSKSIFSQLSELSKGGYLVHGLVILNPNSLITSHLIQSETLFTLLLVSALYFSLDFLKRYNKKSALYGGIFVGLLALTRPAGMYLIFAIPLFLLVAYFINERVLKPQRTTNRIKGYIFGLAGFILVAQLIVTPWYVRNYVETEQFFLSSNSGYYLKDQYIHLLRVGRQWSEKQAIEHIKLSQKDYYEKNQVDDLCIKDERHWSCRNYVFNSILSGIVKEPITNHVKAFIQSWGFLYLSGGASNFRNYLGMSGKEKIVSFQKEKYSGLHGIINFVRSIDLPYLTILLLTTGFSFVTRIAGILGLIYLMKNRRVWPYMTVIVGVIILFTAMYLYLGQSRFRVPLEPFLMIFAVIGAYNFPIKIMNKFKK